MSVGRRRGRILAFQALTAWDMGGSVLDDLLTFPWQQTEKLESELEADYLFPKMMVFFRKFPPENTKFSKMKNFIFQF